MYKYLGNILYFRVWTVHNPVYREIFKGVIFHEKKY